MTSAAPRRMRTAVDVVAAVDTHSDRCLERYLELIDQGPFGSDAQELEDFRRLVDAIASAGAEVDSTQVHRGARARPHLEDLRLEWRRRIETLIGRPVTLPRLLPYQREPLVDFTGDASELKARTARGERLEGYRFAGLKLRNADFSRAHFVDCRFEECNLSYVMLGPGATVIRTSFVDCDLRQLVGWLETEDAQDEEGGGDVEPEQFDLGGTRFASVNFTRCKFGNAYLSGSTFSYCTFQDIANAQSLALRRSAFTYCQFNRVNLRGIDLVRASFTDCGLHDVELDLADLTGTVLCETVLESVRLAGATLDQASFSNCDVGGAVFGHARARPRDRFKATSLTDADLSRAFGVTSALFYNVDWSSAVLPAEVLAELDSTSAVEGAERRVDS